MDKHNQTIKTEEQYVARNYHPLPVVIVRAKDVYVWDEHGKRYMDMVSAYSAVNFGHCNPQLIQALITQAEQLDMVSRAFHTDKLAAFVKYACEISQQEKGLPMNSGAEAVETAIKAARKWSYTVKNIPEDQAEIIVCAGNFHGRTTTIISFSSDKQYRHGFGPFTPGFVTIPFGDAVALKKAITANTAAFLVEPIQGESGIHVPPAGYLTQCAEICRQANVLLIADEVQTGLGRTGKLFACDHENVHPDGLILGKALGGGLLPVSIFLSKAEVMDVFTPGDHGSTFGGNAIAASVGLAALKLLVSEKYADRAAELGEYFIAELKKMHSPIIQDIRGKGLFIGIEINPQYCNARSVCLQLLADGLLTKDTHAAVIRLCPPLTITHKQIDSAVTIIRRSLETVENALQ